ncbi:MAG: ATP synthase F0 subunit B [Anaerolineae bacterium]
MDILTLIDRLEALVNGGWRIPFTAKTVVDENAFFDLIDQMRVSIPQEMKRANDLLQDRERVLATAAQEAERIIEEAHEKAARLVDEHEIVSTARAEAESIKAEARRQADEICKGADEYAIGVLSQLETELSSLLRTTSNGLEQLRKGRMQSSPE